MLILLVILQRFSRRKWGYIPELTTENYSGLLHPINADRTLGRDNVGIDFYPEGKVHSRWTLLSRATAVIGANRGGEANSRIVEGECAEAQRDKDSAVGGASRKVSESFQRTQGEVGQDTGSVEDKNYTGGTNITEYSPRNSVDDFDPAVAEAWRVYNQARDAYREIFGNIIKAHNLVLKVSWSETSRLEERGVIKHAQMLAKINRFINGHIPVLRYARDLSRYSARHIRYFLGIKLAKGEEGGTRTLRLIIMNRFRPIYDLDGSLFWNAFLQCVACMYPLPSLPTSANAVPPSHHRPWMNGIHHGDISFNNLMYDVSAETKDPVGIVNDFDLAIWVNHSTTNNDVICTILFTAIDLLDDGLDDRMPRLYRHDLESFVWVLAYITAANIEYENRTIKASPLSKANAWFKDGDQADRDVRVSPKLSFHLHYGRKQAVSGRYCDYVGVVDRMIQYWTDLHRSLQGRNYEQPSLPNPRPYRKGQYLSEPEDDDAAGSLKLFITTVETLLGKIDVGKGFAKVKTLLLGAIGTPIVAVKAVHAQSHTPPFHAPSMSP